MQNSEKLSQILAKARILEEQITGFISTPGSDGTLKKLLPLLTPIENFQAQSDKILSQFNSHLIENEDPKLVILGIINHSFTQIKKSIIHPRHYPKLFHPNPNDNLTPSEEEKLKSYLLAIREELNKLNDENSAQEKISIKSAAPGA
jgi:hypothetical protein